MALNSDLTMLWRISSPDTAPVTLRATDWISALGAALHQLGRSQHINRMACERLRNGDLIINDLTHDSRYVVQHLSIAEGFLEVDAAPTHSTTERPHAASAALPVRGARAAGDDEALVMGDSDGRSEALPSIAIDTLRSRAPFPAETPAEGAITTAAGRVRMVVEAGPLEVVDAYLDTEEIPIAMGSAEAEEPALPMDLEDVFSLEADAPSTLSDEITLIEASPRRRRLSSALKEIRARRALKRSTP
ncbi:MAG: hypothetical protein P8R54_05545 [Myxococcota bacterium]|nr:hypothetical protein [Myxococcota bacterium]